MGRKPGKVGKEREKFGRITKGEEE